MTYLEGKWSDYKDSVLSTECTDTAMILHDSKYTYEYTGTIVSHKHLFYEPNPGTNLQPHMARI